MRMGVLQKLTLSPQPQHHNWQKPLCKLKVLLGDI